MPNPEQVNQVVAEWVVKAEHDFVAAVDMLKLGRACLTDIACFHAPQCIEKYIKAVMVLEQIPFPKTHDIQRLCALLPARYDLRFPQDQQDRLTEYATAGRYPGGREISLRETQEAVAVARRVRRAIRKSLPKQVSKTGGTRL